uniref:Protein kinase domain-containing protein n=1 Tax=Rhizophagus irregularis (strain DAOM 181602 / DAOM 197198 / MUCL 43194) TaxID=747089 RepID=U9TRP2_RHIID
MAHEFNLDFTENINDGNNHLQQPTNSTTYTTGNNEGSSFMDNQLGTSTQYYHPMFTTLYHASQYNSPFDDIQFQNNFSSVNIPQMDNSEIFRFNIPSFKIIVIPNSVNLANLDIQNLFPQDSTPNIVTENSQTYSQNTFGLNDSFDFNNFYPLRLMIQCLDADPSNRPTASQFYECLGNRVTAICDDPDPSDLSNQFDVAEEIKFSNLEQLHFNILLYHERAIYYVLNFGNIEKVHKLLYEIDNLIKKCHS